MITQKLYPKTRRVSNKRPGVIITEKIDGSNLGFFKYDSVLHIAQRSRVYTLDEALSPESKQSTCTYRGLCGWLQEHGGKLEAQLHEDAGIFGEWIGMGKIQYPLSFKKFQQFAKCNVDKDPSHGGFTVRNMYYDLELFKWSFKDQEQPDFLTTVPVIARVGTLPSVKELDQMYHAEILKQDRPIEGFIVVANNSVQKYVRYKNGKLTEHKE